MGILGTVFGLAIGAICISVLSKVYVGGPVGTFPIYFDSQVFFKGAFFGIALPALAGYLPARKAANIDPVSIFRK